MLPAMVDAPPRPTARWLDRITSVVLAAGVLGVLFTAAPVVLRAGGWVQDRTPVAPPRFVAPRPPPEAPPAQAAPHAGGLGADDAPRQRAASDDPPTFQDEDPRVMNIERMLEELDRQGGIEPGHSDRTDLGLKTTSRVVRAAASFMLHDSPNLRGHEIGSVKAGERLIVVRQEGDFVLVMRQTDDVTSVGWAPKKAISGSP